MAVPYFNYLIAIYEERKLRKIQRKRIRDICDPFDMRDEEFQALWRISKPMAFYILEQLREDLEPKNGEGLPAHLKIADSECRILSVNARYPGRVHDAFIWSHCAVRQEMKRLFERGIGNYFLLGDSGYPLEPWLMTPILDAEQSSPEQLYTNWHCRVRNAVECTNGYLKGSLRCLGIDRNLHYAPEKASVIVYASCIIYNLMKHFGVPLEEERVEIDENEDNETIYNETPARLLRISQARRAELINSYFS